MSYLKASQPTLTKDEDKHPFTECAVFADNMLNEGYSEQFWWHFINQPYLDDEGSTIEDYPDFHMPECDVVDALTDLTAFLKGEEVSSTSAYLK